ncbi:MAG: rhodanese-like domain-containing protein [Candidatus Eisenbacteria bacterium]
MRRPFARAAEMARVRPSPHRLARSGGSLAGALLLAAAVAAPLFAQWPPWLVGKEAKPPVFPEIAVDAAWLREHLSEVVVLDARSGGRPGGHIPGAIAFDPAGVDAGFALGGSDGSRLPAGGEIVCYGSREDPVPPARLFWLLELAGRDGVLFLNGGYESWVEGGGEVARSERARLVVEHASPVDSTRVATLAYMREHHGTGGFEVIDLRDTTSWEGSDRPRPNNLRPGHIPHALPFDPRTVIAEDGLILTGPEIRAVFGEVGPRPSTRIDLESEMLLYDDGASGEGALAYLLLRMAGIEKVRWFPGGYPEWAADPALPVVRIVGAREVEDRLKRRERGRGAPESDLVLIDVRNRRDFEINHVPGAVCLPSHLFRDSLDVFLEEVRPGIDRTATPLATYCYGEDCIRSRQCATWAARAGFRELLWFHGGIREWKEERLPVEGKFE